ncbi:MULTISPECIES: hypothetical protein [unclassified Cryobacterium]|uniref:hypothetical protein n=1 Tax=unclassified Cryobacterium TaxID=2649013 RepID=UPI00106D756F|nr:MULTISPECIES: hypothetical protein [unclassified Cryobacterium]TFC00020.1 hypothetical protein E3O39_02415 [Cryobacterium sp. MDB2-A-1]TFC09292.1 hypothetical protein E3O35_14495 [Cryobacterium sp. MDB2-A-2]TFC17707.1 hypothetical protein E3O51_09435 [Cryobacterium sp. MDB2-10]TFC35622.1 hypothetical protein E3O55_01335 [Cryobacterium sp. MDB1-18-2]TFC40630.1 hypothetical protein E3O50_12980 [Cryobacterium sp. MDB1-18-1]
MSAVLFPHLVDAVTGFMLANTPPPEFNPDTVTPGPAGFLAILFVVVAVVLLGFDLVRRIRRTTYRAEIAERLQAELAARVEAETHPGEASTPRETQQPQG